MTTATDRLARRLPLYGERELRYLRDYLEGLLEYVAAREPTPREAAFRAWLKEGRDNWVREDLTGALTVELPARNGKRPDRIQLPLIEDATA